MSRPSLELRLGQRLALTPTLQQSIRLLQLSTLDLETEISQALAENPMLETSEYTEQNLTPSVASVQLIPTEEVSLPVRDWLSSRAHHDQDDEQLNRPESVSQTTLRDYLLQQLGTAHADARRAALVALLIDDLNDDGMMESSLEEIQAMLDPSFEVSVKDLNEALHLLQSFDPPGIAARDLSECLLLQLRDPDGAVHPSFVDSNVLSLAREVCRLHLSSVATGNLDRLKMHLGCSLSELQHVCSAIRRLNPRPGSPWTRPAADYAIADVIVYKTSLGWTVQLNDTVVPKLRVNEIYAQALGRARDGGHSALHEQLQEARWLIRNISQRFDTILRVSQAIVRHQQEFFEHGWRSVRPLTLREISAELGLHESTVSRATSQKFMLTSFGVVELKRFFSSRLETQSGVTTSSTAVQIQIKELIQNEDRSKPFSDAQLVSLLAKQGVKIARRTVAKYREQMKIPAASLRKSHTDRAPFMKLGA